MFSVFVAVFVLLFPAAVRDFAILDSPQFSVRDRSNQRLLRPPTPYHRVGYWVLGTATELGTESPEVKSRIRSLKLGTLAHLDRKVRNLWGWLSASPSSVSNPVWEDLADQLLKDPYSEHGLPVTRPWFRDLVSQSPTLQAELRRRSHGVLYRYEVFEYCDWTAIIELPLYYATLDEVRFRLRGLPGPRDWPDGVPVEVAQWATWALTKTPIPTLVSYAISFSTSPSAPKVGPIS